jgi:aldehyde:ferredoxin oxidoreductase
MTIGHPKAVRENKTIALMIKIYCRGQHGTKAGLCPECDELLLYARHRMKNCILKENKSTCAQCPVHCYKPVMREKIKGVMRYAGPRMTYKHPVLAMLHLLDGFKTKISERH